MKQSDMVLMPDASTAVIDPFFADSALIIRCDITGTALWVMTVTHVPSQNVRRDYLRATGIIDTVLFQAGT